MISNQNKPLSKISAILVTFVFISYSAMPVQNSFALESNNPLLQEQKKPVSDPSAPAPSAQNTSIPGDAMAQADRTLSVPVAKTSVLPKPVVSAAPSVQFTAEASTSMDGAKDLSVSVKEGKAQVKFQNRTYQGTYDPASNEIRVTTPANAKVKSENWVVKMNAVSGVYSIASLKQEIVYSWGAQKYTATYTFENGLMKSSRYESNNYLYETSFDYVQTPAGFRVKSVIGSGNYSWAGNPNFEWKSKNYYNYDAQGVQAGILSAGYQGTGAERQYYGSYVVTDRSANRQDYIYFSGGSDFAAVFDSLSSFDQGVLIENAARVKTSYFFENIQDWSTGKYLIQYTKDSAGNWIARRVDQKNNKSLIVIGQPDVFGQESNDIFVRAWQEVEIAGQAYWVYYGEGYRYLNSSPRNFGSSEYAGYGLVFSRWDSEKGTQETFVVDFPAQNALQVDGKNYSVSIDKQGKVSVTEDKPVTDPKETLVMKSKTDLAAFLKVSADTIKLKSIEEKNWPDACLGAPNAQACAQVVTPGFLILFEAADGQTYEYHTDRGERIVRIESADKETEALRTQILKQADEKISAVQAEISQLENDLQKANTQVEEQIKQAKFDIEAKGGQLNDWVSKIEELLKQDSLDSETRKSALDFVNEMRGYLQPDKPRSLKALSEMYYSALRGIATAALQARLQTAHQYLNDLNTFRDQAKLAKTKAELEGLKFPAPHVIAVDLAAAVDPRETVNGKDGLNAFLKRAQDWVARLRPVTNLNPRETQVKALIFADLAANYGINADLLKKAIETGKVTIKFNADQLTAEVTLSADLAASALSGTAFLPDPLGYEGKLPLMITYELGEGPRMMTPCTISPDGTTKCPPDPALHLMKAGFRIGNLDYELFYYEDDSLHPKVLNGDNQLHEVKVHVYDPKIVCIKAPCYGPVIRDIRFEQNAQDITTAVSDLSGGASLTAVIQYIAADANAAELPRRVHISKMMDGKMHIDRVEDLSQEGIVLRASIYKYESGMTNVMCAAGASCPSSAFVTLTAIERTDAAGKAISKISFAQGSAQLTLASGETRALKGTNFEDLLNEALKIESEPKGPSEFDKAREAKLQQVDSLIAAVQNEIPLLEKALQEETSAVEVQINAARTEISGKVLDLRSEYESLMTMKNNASLSEDTLKEIIALSQQIELYLGISQQPSAAATITPLDAEHYLTELKNAATAVAKAKIEARNNYLTALEDAKKNLQQAPSLEALNAVHIPSQPVDPGVQPAPPADPRLQLDDFIKRAKSLVERANKELESHLSEDRTKMIAQIDQKIEIYTSRIEVLRLSASEKRTQADAWSEKLDTALTDLNAKSDELKSFNSEVSGIAALKEEGARIAAELQDPVNVNGVPQARLVIAAVRQIAERNEMLISSLQDFIAALKEIRKKLTDGADPSSVTIPAYNEPMGAIAMPEGDPDVTLANVKKASESLSSLIAQAKKLLSGSDMFAKIDSELTQARANLKTYQDQLSEKEQTAEGEIANLRTETSRQAAELETLTGSFRGFADGDVSAETFAEIKKYLDAAEGYLKNLPDLVNAYAQSYKLFALAEIRAQVQTEEIYISELEDYRTRFTNASDTERAQMEKQFPVRKPVPAPGMAQPAPPTLRLHDLVDSGRILLDQATKERSTLGFEKKKTALITGVEKELAELDAAVKTNEEAIQAGNARAEEQISELKLDYIRKRDIYDSLLEGLKNHLGNVSVADATKNLIRTYLERMDQRNNPASFNERAEKYFDYIRDRESGAFLDMRRAYEAYRAALETHLQKIKEAQNSDELDRLAAAHPALALADRRVIEVPNPAIALGKDVDEGLALQEKAEEDIRSTQSEEERLAASKTVIQTPVGQDEATGELLVNFASLPGADRYQVQVLRADGSVVVEHFPMQAPGAASVTERIALTEHGTFSIRVRGSKGPVETGVVSLWSDSVKILMPTFRDGQMPEVSPVVSDPDGRVEISFKPLPKAVVYQVEVDDADGKAVYDGFPGQPGTLGGLITEKLNLSKSGDYIVKVRASGSTRIEDGDLSGWSNPVSFHVALFADIKPAVSPVTVNPDGKAEVKFPKIAGAVIYQVRLLNPQGDILDEFFPGQPEGDSVSEMLDLPDGEYSVIVRASLSTRIEDGRLSQWSEPVSFVKNNFSNLKPVIVSPILLNADGMAEIKIKNQTGIRLFQVVVKNAAGQVVHEGFPGASAGDVTVEPVQLDLDGVYTVTVRGADSAPIETAKTTQWSDAETLEIHRFEQSKPVVQSPVNVVDGKAQVSFQSVAGAVVYQVRVLDANGNTAAEGFPGAGEGILTENILLPAYGNYSVIVRASASQRIEDGRLSQWSEPVAFEYKQPDENPGNGQAPVINAVNGLVHQKIGQAFDFQLTASDLDGDVITYSAKGLPANAVLDANTGKLNWTPNAEQEGLLQKVVFTATDSHGLKSEMSAEFWVLRDGKINTSGYGDRFLNQWYEEGTAAGYLMRVDGEVYRTTYNNRDGGHSLYDYTSYPQLGFDATGWGAPYSVPASKQTQIGNSSTAYVALPAGGQSHAAHFLNQYSAELAQRLLDANNIFVAPSGGDRDDNMIGVVSSVITSLGWSGSDQVFVDVLMKTAGSFHPEVLAELTRRGLVAKTLRMIFDSAAGSHVNVYSGDQARIDAMMTAAHNMTLNDIPTDVRLKEIISPSSPDVSAGVSAQKVFESASSIAYMDGYITHGMDVRISARDSVPGNSGKPVVYRWQVLEGDPSAVQIIPSSDGAEAEIRVSYKADQRRVVIGVSASQPGTGSNSMISAVSFFFPADQQPVFAEGRLTEINVQRNAPLPMGYYSPAWDRMTMNYDAAGKVSGFTLRYSDAHSEEYTADGLYRVESRDASGRIATARKVTFQNTFLNNQVVYAPYPGDIVLTFEYPDNSEPSRRIKSLQVFDPGTSQLKGTANYFYKPSGEQDHVEYRSADGKVSASIQFLSGGSARISKIGESISVLTNFGTNLQYLFENVGALMPQILEVSAAAKKLSEVLNLPAERLVLSSIFVWSAEGPSGINVGASKTRLYFQDSLSSTAGMSVELENHYTDNAYPGKEIFTMIIATNDTEETLYDFSYPDGGFLGSRVRPINKSGGDGGVGPKIE